MDTVVIHIWNRNIRIYLRNWFYFRLPWPCWPVSSPYVKIQKFHDTFRCQSTDNAKSVYSLPPEMHLALHMQYELLVPNAVCYARFPPSRSQFSALCSAAFFHFYPTFLQGRRSRLTCVCAPVVISSNWFQCNDAHTCKSKRFNHPIWKLGPTWNSNMTSASGPWQLNTVYQNHVKSEAHLGSR